MNLPVNIEPTTWLASAYLSQKPSDNAYVGRFAPSPSGQLHQGSLIAALASYLHAHWHGGVWCVRMEDVDVTRCDRGIGEAQIATLERLGFEFDVPVWQSERSALYQVAFEKLRAAGQVYPCTCTRKDIGTGVYKGLCRAGCATDKPIRSWRFRVDEAPVVWLDGDGRCYEENLAASVGDFALLRENDGQTEWTYQLAVVVDDAAQGVTHVVRGADLLDSAARQIALQRALGYPTPIYSHFPLLVNEDGEKLSKSGQAPALDAMDDLAVLLHAWRFLGGKNLSVANVSEFWAAVLVL